MSQRKSRCYSGRAPQDGSGLLGCLSEQTTALMIANITVHLLKTRTVLSALCCPF